MKMSSFLNDLNEFLKKYGLVVSRIAPAQTEPEAEAVAAVEEKAEEKKPETALQRKANRLSALLSKSS